MVKEKYRPDIDGLRAISVILVILFHAKILKIGFIGVDIFFVISGFLITNILIDGKKINILEFYERRARRLLPILFFALIIATILSYLFLFPSELRDFGQSLISTIFGLSNFLFLIESGYFDSSSDLKPLLHTWSLSIEQQFYFLYPFLLIFFKNYKWENLLYFLIILIFLSFSFKLIYFYNFEKIFGIQTENFNFYFSLFRIWELGIGCIFSILKNKKKIIFSNNLNLFFSFIPIIFFCLIYFKYFELNYFQRELLLFLFCFSICYLLINQKNYLTTILKTKPLVDLGKLSYSLYIWHFILFAIYRNYEVEKLNLNNYSILILISLILSLFSYRFIEIPFRNKNYNIYYSFKYLIGTSVTVIFLLGAIFHVFDGLPNRFSKDVLKIYNGKLSRNHFQEICMNKTFQNSCKIGLNKDVNTVLWGDSSLDMMLVSFDKLLKRKKISGLVLHNCNDIIFDRSFLTNECANYYKNIKEELIENDQFKNFIISHRWKNRISQTDLLSGQNKETKQDLINQKKKLNSTISLINNLLTNNKNVYLFYPFPEAKYNVPLTKSKLLHYKKDLVLGQTVKEFFERNQLIFNEFNKLNHKNLIKIYPHEVFCNTLKKNQCVIDINNYSLYSDDNHFTVEGIKILFENIEDYFKL